MSSSGQYILCCFTSNGISNYILKKMVEIQKEIYLHLKMRFYLTAKLYNSIKAISIKRITLSNVSNFFIAIHIYRYV